MDTAALLKALHWRYAVKVFDAERTIPADIWAALEEVLILSASSYGLQPWKFFVITSPELRAEASFLESVSDHRLLPFGGVFEATHRERARRATPPRSHC